MQVESLVFFLIYQDVYKKKLLQELTPLKDGIFESGAYRVPSKSQNSTVMGQGGPQASQALL